MKMAINRCKKQDGEYRFTELLRGLHPDFTRVTHTASRQWFGAGRGQGEKKPLREPPRCRPLSLFMPGLEGPAAKLQRCNGTAQCVHAKYRLDPQS